jgi:hypothetical protein
MGITEETGKVVLGGVAHSVGPFAIDDLEILLPIINDYQALTLSEWTERRTASVPLLKASRSILSVALGKGDEEIGKLKASIDEMFIAVDVVATVAGLVSLAERVIEMTRTHHPQISTESAPT